MDIFWVLSWSSDIIFEPLYSCPKHDQTFGHFHFLKIKLKVPKMCQKFGHFMDIFWTYSQYLDMPFVHYTTCQKLEKTLDILLDILNKFGHILGTLWTYKRVWTYFGQIMDTLERYVSKMCPSPPLCSSTPLS